MEDQEVNFIKKNKPKVKFNNKLLTSRIKRRNSSVT